MVTIGIDNQTGEIIFEENGRRIYDPSQITYIKRHSNWKDRVYELSTNLKNEIDENIERNRTIHFQVPKVIDYFDIKNQIDNLNCSSYKIKDYSKRKDEDIRSDAQLAARKYAECNADSNIFKRKKQNQDIYNKKLPEFVEFYKAKDADAEAKHYREENTIKTQKDAEYKQQYENAKNDLSNFIKLDERLIVTRVTDCINSISKSKIPFILQSCKYIKLPNYTCDILIQLPDDSCIEHRIGNILASGKISIKQRKQNDLKDDWKLCCSGLILLIVANVFNQNTNIQNVHVTARYKELNKAYGSQSVVDFTNCEFNRNSFSNINFSNINPIDTIQAFSTGSFPSVKQTAQKQRTQKVQNTKPKSPFEIECYNELTQNSLSIIDTGLKALFARYGESLFALSEKNRFSSAVKDIFPKNEAERQIVELLLANDCFAKYITSSDKNAAKTKIKEILSGNNLDGDVFLSNLNSMMGGN